MKNSPSYQAWRFAAPTVQMRSSSELQRGSRGLIFTCLSRSHGTAASAGQRPGCRQDEVLLREAGEVC